MGFSFIWIVSPHGRLAQSQFVRPVQGHFLWLHANAVGYQVFRRGNVPVSQVWYPNHCAIQLAHNGDVEDSVGWAPRPERDLLFSLDTAIPAQGAVVGGAAIRRPPS